MGHPDTLMITHTVTIFCNQIHRLLSKREVQAGSALWQPSSLQHTSSRLLTSAMRALMASCCLSNSTARLSISFRYSALSACRRLPPSDHRTVQAQLPAGHWHSSSLWRWPESVVHLGAFHIASRAPTSSVGSQHALIVPVLLDARCLTRLPTMGQRTCSQQAPRSWCILSCTLAFPSPFRACIA